MTNNRDESAKASSKIEMSAEWAPEERAELVTVLDGEIAALDAEEQQLRKTILYEDPYFGKIAAKRDRINQLRHYVERAPSEFLETNRANYSAYVAQ